MDYSLVMKWNVLLERIKWHLNSIKCVLLSLSNSVHLIWQFSIIKQCCFKLEWSWKAGLQWSCSRMFMFSLFYKYLRLTWRLEARPQPCTVHLWSMVYRVINIRYQHHCTSFRKLKLQTSSRWYKEALGLTDSENKELQNVEVTRCRTICDLFFSR